MHHDKKILMKSVESWIETSVRFTEKLKIRNPKHEIRDNIQ